MTDAPAPVPDDAAPTEAMLCFNLYAASHAFIRLYTPHLERLDLTYPQFLVLLSLHAKDGQGVGALGAALALETSTLSPLLKRLTARGLIRRERSQEDERRVVVRLTDAGRARAAEAAKVPGCIAEGSGMDHAEYLETLAVLHRLRGRIAETAGQADKKG